MPEAVATTQAGGDARGPAARAGSRLSAVADAPHVEVILNADAGAVAPEEAGARLRQIFAEAGLRAHLRLARGGQEAAEFALSAARGDTDILVAGGGDGTVNAVASALVGTGKTLGVLPLGTLNHFAKDLGLPLDLEGAARVIAGGHTTEVDVGEVNGRIFLNNSSLGLYPHIVRERVKRQRLGHGKWLAFFRAAVATLRRYPFVAVRLRADGREFVRRTPFVFIGNNEYAFDNFQLGSRPCLNAGRLSLHMTRDLTRWGLFKLALRALGGRLREAKDFDALCAREVWIESRRTRLRVATDGEITILNTPLHYHLRPRALRVLTPAGEAEATG